MTADGLLDRVAFGFVESGAGGGMGVVSTTLAPGSEQLAAWSERLRHHVRLQPSQVRGQTHVPERSLSYLEFDGGTAALLHRVDQGEVGRNRSHAIVGSAADLRASAAALWSWDRWRENGPLAPDDALRVAELLERHRAVAPELDRRCLAQQDNVVPMVRAVLLDPAVRLTVLGAPEDGAVDLVWLLRKVTEPLFPVAPTFSTYEVTDSRAVPDLPSVVFLKAAPAAGETAHVRLYLEDPPLGDRATDAARALIGRYANSSPDDREATYRRWLANVVGDEPEPARRAARVVSALGGVERAVVIAPRLPPPVFADPDPVAPPAPAPAGTRHSHSADKRPKRDWDGVPDERLVDEIAAARPDDVRGGLAVMEQRVGHPGPPTRRLIREGLRRHDFLDGPVATALAGDPAGRWQATVAILRFGYGEDVGDLAVADETGGARTPPGVLLLHAAHSLALRRNNPRKADELLGGLVRREFPLPPEVAQVVTAPPRHAVRRRHSALGDMRMVLRPSRFLFISLVLLVVGFLAGLLV